MVEEVKADRMELLDGVKLWHDGAWVLVIPDTDKSLFHVNAEGKNVAEGKALAQKYVKMIEKWVKA